MSDVWPALAAIEFLGLSVFTVWLVRYFASKSTPWLAACTVFVSWYFGFFGTLFLPIDIAEAYWNMYLVTANVTINGSSPWDGPPPQFRSPTATGTGTPSWSPTATSSLLPAASFSASLTAAPSAGISATGTPSPPAPAPASPSRTSSVAPSPAGSGSPRRTPTASETPFPSVDNSGGGGGGWDPNEVRRRQRRQLALADAVADVASGYRQAWAEAPLPAAAAGRAQRRAHRQPSWLSRTSASARAAVDSAVGAVTSRSHLYRALADALAGPALPFSDDAAVAAAGGHWRQLQVINGTNCTLTPNATVCASNSTGGGSGSEEVSSSYVQARIPGLERMWWTVYWVTFLLTYVIIPVVQEYVAAGEFTRRARLRTAVLVNVVFYAVIGVIAAGAVAYVIFGAGMEFSELVPIAITAANTYGLVLVVLLVGYGAAEVPRALWQAADAPGELRRLEFAAPEVEATLFDARTQLQDVLAAVRQAAGRVAALESSPTFQSGTGAEELAEVKRCLAVVQAKAILEQDALGGAGGAGGLVAPMYGGARGAGLGLDGEDEEGAGGGGWGLCGRRSAQVSDAKRLVGVLAGLHKRLMGSSAKLAKTQFRWDRLVRKVIELEHVTSRTVPPLDELPPGGPGNNGPAKGRARGASLYWSRGAHGAGADANAGGADGDLHVVNNAVGGGRGGLCGPVTAARTTLHGAWWAWRIWAAPYAYLVFAAAAEAMSLLLIWSECTIWVNLTNLVSSNLSVFGMLLASADSDSNHSYFAIQVVSAIPLAYMFLTMTYTLFRMKLFDIHDLSGNRNTDAYSLCVNAALFNRMQFSLAFNYLNVLMHSTDRQAYPQPAFSYSVGAAMKLSLVDWYLPMGTGVIYVMCKLNLFERIMRLMGVDEKGSPVAGNARHEETIAEGRKLIDKAKRQMLGGGSGGAVGGAGVASTLAGGRDVEMSGAAGGGRGGSTANPVSAAGGPGSSAAPPSVPGRFRTLESFSGAGAGGGSNPAAMSRGVVSGGEPEVVGLGSSSAAGAGGRFSTAFNSVGAGLATFNSRAMAAFGGAGAPPAATSATASSAYRPGSVAASGGGGGGGGSGGSLRDFSSVALTLDPLDSSASGPQSLAAKLKGKRPGAPGGATSSGPSTPARPTSGASSSWAGAAGGQIS